MAQGKQDKNEESASFSPETAMLAPEFRIMVGAWHLATRVLMNDRLLRMFAARAIMLFNEFGRP